jgi:hypothetical protein
MVSRTWLIRTVAMMFLLVFLVGCAGRVPGTAVWTQVPQATPTTWDYGYPAGALLGRVVVVSETDYVAYGCPTPGVVGSVTFTTLAQAESFVATSCANVNKIRN